MSLAGRVVASARTTVARAGARRGFSTGGFHKPSSALTGNQKGGPNFPQLSRQVGKSNKPNAAEKFLYANIYKNSASFLLVSVGIGMVALSSYDDAFDGWWKRSSLANSPVVIPTSTRRRMITGELARDDLFE